MTEEAKQTLLILFQELLRDGEPTEELQHFQAIHDKLLADLTQEPASDLQRRLLQIPAELAALIAETRVKYERTQRIITYIKTTEAALLTREHILGIG